jgi:hypothetical protein
MSVNIPELVALDNQQLIEMAPAVGAERPMHGVSDRYSYIPTLEAVDLMRDAGWMPVAAQQSQVIDIDRAGYQRHMIRFAMPGMDLGEERLDMLLYNSHDTGSAFRILASIWRYICMNGLKTSNPLVNFTHTHINFDAHKFVESARLIARSIGQIAPQIENMKQIELTPVERREFGTAVLDRLWDGAENAPVTVDSILTERRYGDMKDDLWRTFNVVQENVCKGGVKGQRTLESGQVRNYTTRPVRSLVRDLTLNQQMWELAEDVAYRKNS